MAEYAALAQRHGLSATALALRFVLSHPLVASAVVGATSSEQLAELIACAQQPWLSEELRRELDAVHERYPNPTP